jgi:hypothetical protein
LGIKTKTKGHNINMPNTTPRSVNWAALHLALTSAHNANDTSTCALIASMGQQHGGQQHITITIT